MSSGPASATEPTGTGAPVGRPFVLLTVGLVVLVLAAVVLLGRVHAVPLTAPTAYLVLSLVLLFIALVVPTRTLRLLGNGIGDTPDTMLTVPFLIAGPWWWTYAAAITAVCLSMSLRLRLKPWDVAFNTAQGALSGLAATAVYALVRNDATQVFSPEVVAGAALGMIAQEVISESLTRLGCHADGKADVLPPVRESIKRAYPVLSGVVIAQCGVALAVSVGPYGTVLAFLLIIISIAHQTVQARETNLRWLAERLFEGGERVRRSPSPEQVRATLEEELAILWQSGAPERATLPSRGHPSVALGNGDYLVLGRSDMASALPELMRASDSMVSTAAETERALVAQQDLLARATTDELTGLGNRRRLWAAIDDAMPAASPAARMDLLVLDVDKFSVVNDTYGQAIGDRLLVAVGARLAERCEPDDVVVRVSGDEFAVLRAAKPASDDPAHHARLLRDVLSRPYTVDGNVLNVAVSIGYACATEPISRDTFIGHATAAVLRGKRQGPSSVTFASEEVIAEARRRMHLDHELRQAIAREEFRLHYQPIVDARTGETTAVEALLRWERDGVPVMSPMDFIPYAEESGAIVQIGAWVLGQACREVHAFNQAHPQREPLSVSVNVSTVHIAQPGFVRDVFSILRQTGLPGRRLIVEVTETFAALDMDQAVAVGHALSGLGVRLWLDDFGTGYSSLEYLRRLPIEAVKLDRSFITDLDSDEQTRAFLESLVALCRSIDRPPLAEGVEREEQRRLLLDLDCTLMQGYYFARPMPLADLESFLLAPRLRRRRLA